MCYLSLFKNGRVTIFKSTESQTGKKILSINSLVSPIYTFVLAENILAYAHSEGTNAGKYFKFINCKEGNADFDGM